MKNDLEKITMNDRYYWKCFILISRFFNNDTVKTIKWFSTKNPLLGNVTPVYMYITGRSKKLFDFVMSNIEGNFA